MTRWPLTRSVLVAYLGLGVAAAVAAAVRLSQSSELPGLAAIELVLLALPWSVALGAQPLSRLGWGGMIVITLGGVLLNAVLLRWLAGRIQKRWLRGPLRS